MNEASGMVVFGPRELVEFLVKEYDLRKPTDEKDILEAAKRTPKVDEIFAIVAFAVHLNMRCTDINAAFEALG
ncbi:hypothetical protein A3F28_03180 [Candidatus Uhrbacteria bacterium RIFCSPHIGHO2_12_FULL_57_11]|uniref:Uncharacterized protein n=2 Tax=Candidatus Uhriibacteriota TaxID=1752732 RepID=A0A1F7UIY8_9BACT|nr:MAG: hypothetical protein A3D72_04035 [Candidatus Uhrbacteria bacterium RIFCSPHIGHO2_02_FULL_57_19]OGL78233.1 MAG: hypothetical protein A3F28_03180 [Candidatus Uhrbacteria bacterium RIFCSPHIGHO2_12_FULL_57_11]